MSIAKSAASNQRIPGACHSVCAGSASLVRRGHACQFGLRRYVFYVRLRRYRGACSNAVLIWRDWFEERLLDELQNEVLKRDSIEYVLEEFGNHLQEAFSKLHGQLGQMRQRKEKLEGELRRLAATAAETGPVNLLGGSDP